MRKFLVILLTLSMVFSMFGCGGGTDEVSDEGTAEPSDISVAFIPKLTGNSFFESANLGAQDIAEEVGFECAYTGNPEASVANQVQVINSAVQQGFSALAISSVTPDGLNNALKAAKEAGLKIVCWDSDVQNDMRSLHVAQGTPEQLGEMLVEMAAMQMTDEQKQSAKYCWHYSSATVTDQNSWQVAGEKYIKETYPGWVNVAPDNYYSGQDAEKAVSVGESILKTYPDIDAIICNDSTALPGQAQAAENLGLSGKDVIITGFCTPNGMRDFCKNGTVPVFGLWDCKVQGAMGAYLAYWLAAGNEFKVGDTIDIPTIGEVEVLPNTVLDPKAYTADDSGVVLLPERTIFTKDNIDDYNF
ncbi:autoinducer 2 ABC transporter substrate-binding protein LsrB [Sinanaerobacter chloroacetimidivorans]|jgi:AI-2 transport system substrate-binding protein|uniref:Autoinducer 2 ABC transporter substrate-binding protein LsrB n=1 Tax=Sinanaerobacter chloroacetimidivorans TaxID=2818044 RepID=A0A8J7W0T3_9FIRM|nr:autoinducer 2 ABC transporter substrate-binding protein LsrB [Sinanaerobacter chloroacetimidivorans]MBR0598709.1 autoinducer 2 ABC transporter substrate-binding protein LsrB [Sinanaerobacter chloroacetimidivorans]